MPMVQESSGFQFTLSVFAPLDVCRLLRSLWAFLEVYHLNRSGVFRFQLCSLVFAPFGARSVMEVQSSLKGPMGLLARRHVNSNFSLFATLWSNL